MPRSRPTRGRLALPLLLLLAWPAPALEVRVADDARQLRFTGFPSQPQLNPQSFFDGTRYHAVGWQPNRTERQFALVTRQHVLSATHLNPTPTSVRFLAPDGQLVTRAIAATAPVRNADDSASDLMLLTLDAPIDAASGIDPLPYLDLDPADDYAAFLNLELHVFGFTQRVGRGRLSWIDEIEIGSRPTHCLRFLYLDQGEDDDDCHFAVGDSGSPSFVETDGAPALVGTHSAIDPFEEEMMSGIYNYDALVPHYVPALDAMLAAQGYRMRPQQAATTSIDLSTATTPATPRRALPLAVDITLENDGAAATGNLELELAPGHPPDRILAPGWSSYGDPAAPTLRRARLDAGATTTITLEWDAAPDAESLPLPLSWRSDRAPSGSHDATLALAPSFAAYVADLDLQGRDDDPDGDRLRNLVEYALGSDPGDAASPNPTSSPPPAMLVRGGDELAFCHPERTDKALRGLDYLVEHSTDLAGWSTTLPAGSSSELHPFDPPLPGFSERIIRVPRDAGRHYLRLRVELEE